MKNVRAFYIKFFLKVRESCVMSANNKRFHVVINSISSCAWTKIVDIN